MSDDIPVIHTPRMCGSTGPTKPRDDYIVGFVNGLKEEIFKEVGKTYGHLEVINYREQSIGAVNYFVKIRGIDSSGNKDVFHVRLYKPMPHDEAAGYKHAVHGVALNKTEDEHIEYF